MPPQACLTLLLRPQASLALGNWAETPATSVPSPHTPRSETPPSSSGRRSDSCAPSRGGTPWPCCRSSRPSGRQPRSELRAARSPVADHQSNTAPRALGLLLGLALQLWLQNGDPTPGGAQPLRALRQVFVRQAQSEPGTWQRLGARVGEEVQLPPLSFPLLLQVSSNGGE